jgi:hypothetical protein
MTTEILIEIGKYDLMRSKNFSVVKVEKERAGGILSIRI